MIGERHRITSPDQLAQIYDAPSERALLKQIDRLDRHCRDIIAASPFFLLATSGRTSGLDCSPRGDRPGFVEVANEKTLLVPDRRGNNRVDSLRNVVENPAVGLLFLVPGMHETLRVNGRAIVTVDPDLLERFTVNGQRPRSVLVVTVEEVFIQCARALVRAELWNPARHVPRDRLPSMGTILAAHTRGKVDPVTYDEDAEARLPQTLY